MRTLRFVFLALCAAAAACKAEKLCPGDQSLCDGHCTAIGTDPASCGACGHACAAGESCVGGACFCPDGRASCGGACVDLASDPANCGACGAACDPALLCTTGDTVATTCAAACAGAAQTACDRACLDLDRNPWNCGACGRACGSNERCDSGRCVADLYLACYNSGEVREATFGLAPAGIPLPVAPGPMGLAWVGARLFVASSQYGSAETLAAVRFDPPSVRAAVVLTTTEPLPDFEYLAEHGGLLYLAHALVDSLLVVTPEGTVVDEVPFAAPGSPTLNPQGIAFVNEKAYVALNGTTSGDGGAVVVLDVSAMAACAAGTQSPPCTTELARIDVQPLASATVFARPSRIAVAGTRAFVTLWNLDASWNPPAGSTGRLAVIDLATDALDGAVADGGIAGLLDLGSGCLNPADLAVHGGVLYVTCGAFDYSNFPAVRIAGSGIAVVDVSGAVPGTPSVLAMADDEAPGKLAFCAGAGYVGDRNSGRVFRFDPASGIAGSAELCPSSNGFAYVSDVACSR